MQKKATPKTFSSEKTCNKFSIWLNNEVHCSVVHKGWKQDLIISLIKKTFWSICCPDIFKFFGFWLRPWFSKIINQVLNFKHPRDLIDFNGTHVLNIIHVFKQLAEQEPII